MKLILGLRSKDELACCLLATPTITVTPSDNSTGANGVVQHSNFATENCDKLLASPLAL